MTAGSMTMKEIGQAVGVTWQAVQKRARKEGWNAQTMPGQGKTQFFLVSDLPEDVRLALAAKQAGAAAMRPEREDGPEAPKQKALDKASLKVELISEFHRYVNQFLGDRTGAAQTFVDLYNTGRFYPYIYDALGKKSLPTLYRWSKQLREADYDATALADCRGGHNRGQTKVTEREAEVLLGLLCQQEQLRVGTAYRYMKEILRPQGVTEFSSRSAVVRFVEAFKAQHADYWTLSREGEKALVDKVLPYLERDWSRVDVGDILIADGHVCNFRVINPFTGKPVRPTLIGWLDGASRYLVGYSYMLTEDFYAIHTALRAAIMQLGKIPKHVLLDNGKAFKSKIFMGTRPDNTNLAEMGFGGIYSKLGIGVHFAKPYNARAKTIERFFKTMGGQFEQLLPAYIGASIQQKPARMRRNEKFMQDLSPDRPLTIEEAYALFDAWLEYYHEQPHQGLKGRTPAEVFEAGQGQGVDHDRLRYLMLIERKAKVYRNGVRFWGRYYWHELLYGLNDSVIIKYDPGFLLAVDVYDRHEQFLCTARLRDQIHPLATVVGGDDFAAFKHQIREQNRLKRETMRVVSLAAKRNEVRSTMEQLPWGQMLPTAPEIIDQAERVISENLPEERRSVVEFMGDAPIPDSRRKAYEPTRVFEYLDDEELEEEFKAAMARTEVRNED